MVNQTVDRSRISGLVVDFGGTKIAAARYLNGRQLDYLQTPTQAQASVTSQINTIAQLLGELQLRPEDRVVAAVSGRVDQRGNWYAVNTQTLSKIDCVPLKTLLQDRLQREVHVLNDCVAGAIGEANFGAGVGYENHAYISVSTGIGGVCVVNGQPLLSANGLAGHVGFVSSRYASQMCGSGRMATVESVASGRAIASLAAQAGHPNLTTKEIFQYHLAGQDWATQLIQQSASATADLCVNLAAIAGIECAVVGGSIGLAPGYIAFAQAQVDLEPHLFQMPLKAAALGQNAVLIGALV